MRATYVRLDRDGYAWAGEGRRKLGKNTAPRGGASIVQLDNGGYRSYGVAICSTLDGFRRSVGRSIAEGRAAWIAEERDVAEGEAIVVVPPIRGRSTEALLLDAALAQVKEMESRVDGGGCEEPLVIEREKPERLEWSKAADELLSGIKDDVREKLGITNVHG